MPCGSDGDDDRVGQDGGRCDRDGACGQDGGDDNRCLDAEEEKLFRHFLHLNDPNWQDIKCDPNSISSKASDALGDGIDGLCDLIGTATAWLSALPIRLYRRVTGRDPLATASRRYM